MTTGPWPACARSIQNLPTRVTRPLRTAAGRPDSQLQFASGAPQIAHPVSSEACSAVSEPEVLRYGTAR